MEVYQSILKTWLLHVKRQTTSFKTEVSTSKLDVFVSKACAEWVVHFASSTTNSSHANACTFKFYYYFVLLWRQGRQIHKIFIPMIDCLVLLWPRQRKSKSEVSLRNLFLKRSVKWRAHYIFQLKRWSQISKILSWGYQLDSPKFWESRNKSWVSSLSTSYST